MNTTTQSNEKTAPPVVLPVDLRDYFAAKAPFTLSDAVLAADLESAAPSVEVATVRVIHDPAKRAVAMAMLAALRLEYADAMLAARDKP